MYGLSLSPILLAFQHKPRNPICFVLSVTWPLLSTVGVSNIVGYMDLVKAAVHINNNITTNNEGKSNIALIPQL